MTQEAQKTNASKQKAVIAVVAVIIGKVYDLIKNVLEINAPSSSPWYLSPLSPSLFPSSPWATVCPWPL